MYSRRSVLTGSVVLSVGLAGCSDELSTTADSGSEDDSNSRDDENAEMRSVKRELSHKYGLGLVNLEGAEGSIRLGISDFNLERYDESAEAFERAEESLEEAGNQISEATDLTYEIEESEAREITETGESYVSLLQDAAAAYRQAANRAANDDDSDIINSRIEQAESYESEADQSEPREQSVLEDVLEE